MLPTAMHYSHTLLKEIVQPGHIVVDATMGNGFDTELLATLVGPKGHVFAFDIQEQALAATRQRLAEKELLSHVSLIHRGHEHVADYVDGPIQAAIFNLGYLPRGDKGIITLPQTTKQALEALLPRLAPKGRIIIVCYYGHQGGAAELAAIQQFCASLPQESYNVMSYQFINQRNQPPILYCIERKKTALTFN
ncbi:tRNA (mnm(5)s(2)U34)-methyltransferase [Enterococcus sp. DIV0876]|uniref:tRNA (mnm(5)s(2)U34)-methyltransferase n=1 Tax=Enterococcus sp. DIV0876 TaxID=2774633 RepID=UPI003D2FBAC5